MLQKRVRKIGRELCKWVLLMMDESTVNGVGSLDLIDWTGCIEFGQSDVDFRDVKLFVDGFIYEKFSSSLSFDLRENSVPSSKTLGIQMDAREQLGTTFNVC